MLFLAVFCGFLAENIREHQIERDKEKQFIQSLLQDLKDDVENFKQKEEFQKRGVAMLDTLFYLLDDPDKARKNGDQLYYIARVGPRTQPFVNNNRTIEQLKNSGGFRLIKNPEASNRIMGYYTKFPLLRLLEDNCIKEFDDYKVQAAKIFDPTIFRRQEASGGNVTRSTDNPVLRTYDKDFLKQMGMFTIYLNGSRRSIIHVLESIHKSADELIVYLEQQYPPEK